jgi:CheY-like chemotaxis protein
MNLATNALHAMDGRPGQLAVKLDSFLPDEEFIRAHPEFRPVQYARLTVADTGHGMDAKTLERIFEPFFTTKPVGKGTGLGLAVVLGLVQAHDGVITVESQPGLGTTFRLYFPAKMEDAAANDVAAAKLPGGRGQKILLVDDEPALTATFQRLLARLNYQVTSRNSAREAIALFRENPAHFDLVITDLTMPEINGLELTRQLRALRPDLPVLLASGFSAELNRENLHAAGVADLLEKPISMTALADVLQRTLAKP